MNITSNETSDQSPLLNKGKRHQRQKAPSPRDHTEISNAYNKLSDSTVCTGALAFSGSDDAQRSGDDLLRLATSTAHIFYFQPADGWQ